VSSLNQGLELTGRRRFALRAAASFAINRFAEGPSGPAKIHSDEPKHALGLVHYLRTIGYKAWIEDTNGNEIQEPALKKTLASRTLPSANAL
jgi:hypothetical protein